MNGLRQLSFFNSTEQEKKKQADIAKRFTLGFWYYTEGKKCCEVYPKFKTDHEDMCYLECPVCGDRTGKHHMAWQAWTEWDEMKETKEE